MKDKLRFCWFLLIPLITFLIVLTLGKVWGPYYYSMNSDPAYLYLIGSLKIATLQPVHHVDNPGTTVQVVGGVIVKTLASVKTVKDIESDVFKNPEYYLNAINRFLFSINIIAIFILGIIVYMLTRNLWMSLLIQSAPFASWLLIKAMLKVSPEPMLVFTCIWFIILLVWAAEKRTHLRNPGLFTFLFSIVTAFGLATKLTFLPFIIAVLIILPGFKWKGIYLALTAVLFHIFIIPAIPHYDFLIRWVGGLILHTRQYGSGEPNIVDVNYSFRNLIQLIALDHTFYITVLISIIMLAFIFANEKIRNELSANPIVKILLGTTVAVIFHLMLVAKHYNPHYMIPSLMLFTTIIYLNIKTFRMIRERYPEKLIFPGGIWITAMLIVLMASLFFMRHFIRYLPGNTPEEWIQKILVPNSVLLIGFILLLGITITMLNYFKIQKEVIGSFLNYCVIILLVSYQIRHIDLEGFRTRLKSSRQEAQDVIGLMENKFKHAVKIYGKRSSSLISALKSGANSNFPQGQYFKKMKEIYPDETIFFWGLKNSPRVFENWTEQVELAEIMEAGNTAILIGDIKNLTIENLREIEVTNHVELKNVFDGESEKIYLIHNAGMK